MPTHRFRMRSALSGPILAGPVLAAALLGATPALAISARTLLAPVGESYGDEFGIAVARAGDVNGDGHDDVIVGAWGSSAAALAAGRAYIYLGGPGADSIPDLVLSGHGEFDNFGRAVASAGDVNGDGYDDVIVASWTNDVHGRDSGRAYVYFGGSSMDTVADLTLSGEGAFDLFGASVAGVGDWNGDGYDDVLVGAHHNDGGSGNVNDNRGRAYVFFGGTAPNAVPDLTLTGEASGDFFGISVAGLGDVNGDGRPDVIVGAYRNDAGGTDAGRAYIYFGGPGADATADRVLTGEAAGDEFGRWVGGGGDINGDGFRDVVAGAALNDAGGTDAGRAYAYFGGPGADPVADLTLTGAAAGDGFGRSVAIAGDVSGDGIADVIVGAYDNDARGTDAGRAYLYFGGPALDAVADITLDGEAAGDEFGFAVAGAGDVNGDGLADVVAGAHLNDAASQNAGRAYVVTGSRSVPALSDRAAIALALLLAGAAWIGLRVRPGT